MWRFIPAISGKWRRRAPKSLRYPGYCSPPSTDGRHFGVMAVETGLRANHFPEMAGIFARHPGGSVSVDEFGMIVVTPGVGESASRAPGRDNDQGRAGEADG